MDEPASTNPKNKTEPLILSKKQKKRLERHKKWEASKKARRQRERQRKKENRAAARERGEVFQGRSRKSLKSATMRTSSCRIRVAVDVSFDHLMSDWDIAKLCKQLQRCYAVNRRMEAPLQLFITSFSGKTKQKLEEKQGCLSWDVYFKTNSYMDEFNKDEIIYLTSESPNSLEDVEDSNVYVIGGLVDHNSHKGVCHSLAEKHGVKHARLPLDTYVDMKTRKVLTVNHVFQILAMKSENSSWKDAFMGTLALRKGATPKVDNEIVGSEDSSDESDLNVLNQGSLGFNETEQVCV